MPERDSEGEGGVMDKTNITIEVDLDVLEAFKARAAKTKTTYQALINTELRRIVKTMGKRPLIGSRVEAVYPPNGIVYIRGLGGHLKTGH
jgi:hypothetical protein